MTTAALASEMLADATGRSARPVGADASNACGDALPAGTRLHEFELQSVLGIGGFGIVYRALDHALLREVAIKEYMPGELARRGAGAHVSMRSAAHAETFASGLQSFLKEAQLLARFDHPSLVKVHRYWEANGTAYMAMQYVAGRTLNEVRQADPAPPDEAGLRRLLEPLLGALELLHEQGVYHRDISPDNILVMPDGCPVLLDFGAARHVIGDRTQALTAVLKPSFAPIEQYGDMPGMRQGPWTDLYALGAVVHHLLTGRHPLPAVVRAVHDHMQALSAPEPVVAGISPAVLAAIDWMLGVRPQERPPDVQALREALAGTRVPPPPTPRLPEAVADEASAAHDVGSEAGAAASGAAAGAATSDADVGAEAAGWQPTVRRERERRPAEPPCATEPPRITAQRRGIAALAVALAVAGGLWAVGMRADQQPGTTLPLSAAPADAVAPLAAASATPTPTGTADESTAPHVAPPLGKAAVDARATPLAAAHVAVKPKAAPASPREACGERNFLAMSMCLNQRCREPAFRQHPQCLELKAYDQRRREDLMNR